MTGSLPLPCRRKKSCGSAREITVFVGAALWLNGTGIGPMVLLAGLAVFVCYGFFTLQPNEARVLILFGAYKGTVRHSGFHWANPLFARSGGNEPSAAPPPKRVKVGPLSVSDGTVTRVELLNNQADPYFRSIAEGAVRAVKRASPLNCCMAV